MDFMANEKHPIRIPPASRTSKAHHPAALDWPAWIERIERKRRGAHRSHRDVLNNGLPNYFIDATCSNFRLEGMDVSLHEAHAALEKVLGSENFARERRIEFAITSRFCTALKERWQKISR